MGSHQKKWPASGAWLGAAPDSERQRWSSNLGGAERGDSAAGDGSSVTGLFAEQRGREKGRGKWGSRPGRRRAAVGRRCLNRGGNGRPKVGPAATVSGGGENFLQKQILNGFESYSNFFKF
jgi:hypothetical protein